MPRIDPVKLLTCISSLLSPNGGIRSTAEVKRLASLMGKYSKKLVSKCIYIQILKCTDTELLGQFMTFGGWALVHTWLTDGIESKNWPLVQELLELLLLCPVDVPRLQSNSAPKLVKSLSREEGNDGVRILAAKLVEQWLKIARGEITSQTNVVNKENLANRQSHLIVDSVTDSSLLDNCLSSEINGNDVTDSAIDHVIGERDDDSLVFKISVKDGMKTVHKVTDLSPKKNKEIDLAKSPSVDGIEKRHKDEKSSSRSKDSKDRERSKDKDKDRHHKKSSSSSTSHKLNSSSSKHSSSSSNSKSHKSSSSSHKSSSSSSSGRDKNKHRSKSSSSSSRDKKEDKDKLKSDASKTQAEKDKDTLAKIQPQPLAKVKIPKKISDDPEKITENGTTTILPKKKSISIEVRKDSENRPKTAKTYSTQFRNHGLGEEAPPPPSRRDLKKPSSVPTSGLAIPPTKRSISPISMAREADKKIKLSHVITSPTIEKAGSIKLIAAKPKPSALIESDMFMDAITAATTKKEPRKRKRGLKDGETNGDKPNDASKDTKDAKSVSSAPLRFYKDTLEDNANKDDSKMEITEGANTEDGESKEKKSKNEDENGDGSVRSTADSPEEPEEETQKRGPGPGCGPDGPPGVLTIHRRKGPKKSLRWKPQETLEEVRFFELDENERINVTKTFVDMKQMERTSEREAFLISRKIDSEDTMMEQMEWLPLILVDEVPELPISTNSIEKDVQTEREKSVLQAIYFNRALIPDSPHEPDCVIPYQNTQPQIIPLDDVTGNPDAVHDFTKMAWPEPRGSPPSQGGNNFNELGGLSAFGSFNQFGNNMANWQNANPNPNPIIGLQPPPALAFGGMMPPPEVAMNMNPLQQFNAANIPMMAVANNMGYINNYAQPVPPMMNDNNRNNRGNNRFGANNVGNNNWQTQGSNNNNNNNNNQRQNWMKNRRICTGFQRGFCRHGDKCKYLHPGVNGPKF